MRSQSTQWAQAPIVSEAHSTNTHPVSHGRLKTRLPTQEAPEGLDLVANKLKRLKAGEGVLVANTSSHGEFTHPLPLPSGERVLLV